MLGDCSLPGELARMGATLGPWSSLPFVLVSCPTAARAEPDVRGQNIHPTPPAAPNRETTANATWTRRFPNTAFICRHRIGRFPPASVGFVAGFSFGCSFFSFATNATSAVWSRHTGFADILRIGSYEIAFGGKRLIEQTWHTRKTGQGSHASSPSRPTGRCRGPVIAGP